MTPLDSVADVVRHAFASRHGTRTLAPWRECSAHTREEYRNTVRAALHGIGCLPDATMASVWKRLKYDPTKPGVTPDQATRALLDALFEELTA